MIELKKKVYQTSEHPEMAITLCNLAQNWMNLGETTKVFEYFESALGKNFSIFLSIFKLFFLSAFQFNSFYVLCLGL